MVGGSYIYFVQAATGGPIKVGVTGDVKHRLSTMQTGCPVTLVLLAHMPGDEDDEWRLHQKLAAHRFRGEWYHPHADVLACLEDARKHPQSIPLKPVERNYKSCLAARAVQARHDVDEDTAFEIIRGRRDISSALDWGRNIEACVLIDEAVSRYLSRHTG